MHCDVATFMTNNCEQTLRYARVFLFNIGPSERFNVSDGFEVLIKKINLSWIRRVRALGHTPYAGYACLNLRKCSIFNCQINNILMEICANFFQALYELSTVLFHW